MAHVDNEWVRISKNIMENGWDQDPSTVRARYKSDNLPAPTRYLIGDTIVFQPDQIASLQVKNINPEKPLEEIFWIMIDKTSDISALHARGVHFWDDWVIDEGEWKGTIGPAYGYQVGLKSRKFPLKYINWKLMKPNFDYTPQMNLLDDTIMLDQMDFLIQSLINSPFGRRHIISLWNVEMLDKMKLEPCVWNTEWHVGGDRRLYLEVRARSNDIGLGNPFNMMQYQFLQHTIAQIIGLEPGVMRYNMGNIHIYDRHFDGVNRMIKNLETVDTTETKLIINPDLKNLYEATVDDYRLENYNPLEKIKLEIAV